MDDNLLEQLLNWVRSHYFGKYRGTVTDNADPTQRGRLKVKVPALLGDLEVWAMPCVPYAGDQVGFYSLPEAGAGVWVEFEAGDLSYPVWTGCFWADQELPPEATAASIRIWRTPKLTLKVDDDAGESLVQTGDDMKISMTASDGVMTTVQNTIKHTVSSQGITSDSGGMGKVEVTTSSVNLNSGAMEVT